MKGFNASFKFFSESIEEIARANWNKATLGEAVVRQVIVLRLIHAAGFDIWNPEEVVPEETNAANNRPDFIVSVGDHKESNAFVLEIKRRNAQLTDGNLGQAVSYAGQIGIRWTWLTNGHTWIVADEQKPGPYPDRVVLKLELLRDKTDVFAHDLYRLLDRRIWVEGRFEAVLRQVRDELEQRNKRKEVLETKKPELEKFAIENTIKDLGKAADLMVRLGLLSDLERDVLVGRDNSPLEDSSSDKQAFALKIQNDQPKLLPSSQGKSAFEPKILEQPDLKEVVAVLHLTGRGVSATAYLMKDHSLVIQPGSCSVSDPVPSLGSEGEIQNWHNRRKKLVDSGAARFRNDGVMEYAEPVRYEKPSSAGAAVLGRTVDGPREWKDKNGKSYREFVGKRS